MFLTFQKSDSTGIETTNCNGRFLFKLNLFNIKSEDILVLFNQTEKR